MARAGGLSARRVARLGVSPLGARRDLCGKSRTRPRWPRRAAAGPPIWPALPAPPRSAARQCRMSDERDRLRLLEALLFAAPAPLSEAELAARLGDGADVAALLRELAETYAG